jgi:hypothetical protein
MEGLDGEPRRFDGSLWRMRGIEMTVADQPLFTRYLP